MSTAIMFKKANPHAPVFFDSLNLLFFLILLIISFIVAGVTQMPLLILVTIGVGFGIKYFLDKNDLQQYQLTGANKSYYLISEGRLQRGREKKHNFLEDFITDFLNCDWEDRKVVSQYKAVFRLINPKKFPNAKLDNSSNDLREELRRSYQKSLYVIADDLKLQDYLLELESLLKKNNKKRKTFALEQSKKESPKIEKESPILNYKIANETGIAGFVLCFILPLQSFQLNLSLSAFPEFMDGKFPITLIFILASLALIFSIDGISKDGKKYQKGLAWWGFVFNLLFVMGMIIEYFSNIS